MADPFLVTLPQNDSVAPPGLPESSFDQAGNDDLEYAVKALDAVAPLYEEARLYANGQSPELFFMSEAARQQVAQMIQGFRLNFAGLVPKVLVNRLSILDFTDIDESMAAEIVDANKFWRWSGQSIKETLIDGDHFIIVRDNDGDVPTLIPSSATEARVFYDSETERTIELGIRRWKMRDPDSGKVVTRANLWYPDRIERFILPPDSTWKRYETDEIDAEEGHDFGQVPIAHWSTGFPYGTPVHRDAYGPQDMIVKAVMTLMAGTEFNGWPQRYELNKIERAGQSALPGRTAEGQSPRMRSGPGTIMSLYADSAGAFPAADLDKLCNVVDLAVRAMAQVTEIPMQYFDPAGARASGESRLVADAPLKALAAEQRRSIGSGAGHMMELASIALGSAPDQITTVWAPDPIISDETWWNTAKVRNELGVSREQIFIEAGYTQDQIAAFNTEPAPIEPPSNDGE